MIFCCDCGNLWYTNSKESSLSRTNRVINKIIEALPFEGVLLKKYEERENLLYSGRLSMGQLLKEYKGEEVITGMIARLVPPNNHYPDCMCMLLLTKYHLYVLEDNFDNTYTEHFAFPILQIQKMEIQKYKIWERVEESGLTMILSTALSIIMNTAAIPTMPRQRVVRNKLFMITYMNGQGGSDTLYFQDLQSSTADMEVEFKKLQAQYGVLTHFREEKR